MRILDHLAVLLRQAGAHGDGAGVDDAQAHQPIFGQRIQGQNGKVVLSVRVHHAVDYLQVNVTLCRSISFQVFQEEKGSALKQRI